MAIIPSACYTVACRPPAPGRFALEQLCPHCQWIVTAEFCDQDSCRRKFVPQPGYSSCCCPLHDPALLESRLPPGFRTMKFEKSLFCPRCGGNLFGYRIEDKEQTGGLAE